MEWELVCSTDERILTGDAIVREYCLVHQEIGLPTALGGPLLVQSSLGFQTAASGLLGGARFALGLVEKFFCLFEWRHANAPCGRARPSNVERNSRAGK